MQKSEHFLIGFIRMSFLKIKTLDGHVSRAAAIAYELLQFLKH
jgi:hypothetical protein